MLRDLHLQFEPAPDQRCRVSLSSLDSPDELAAGYLAIVDAAPLSRELRSLESQPEWSLTDALVRNIGCQLFALLPQEVRSCLWDAVRHAVSGPARIRLRLTLAPPFVALPWEYLLLQGPIEGRTTSMAPGLRENLHIVRCPAAGPTRDLAPLVADPLRVLVVWADPGSPGHPRLQYAHDEIRGVFAAAEMIPGRRVVVEELPYATPAALQRCLNEQPPDIIHFVGHGELRSSGGMLILHGERPGTEAGLYAEELCAWLSGTRVRLVVLCACCTAGAQGTVGERVAASGVPAVIGMQQAFRDLTAGRFSRAFYSSFFAPCPADEALAEARHTLASTGEAWGVPVLYLWSRNSDLFEFPKSGTPNGPAAVHLPYLRNPQFVGRRELLKSIHAALGAETRCAALVGMGGAGKSQVAVEYGHSYLHDYPGGVFWLSARDTARLTEELAALGRHFGVPEELATTERAHWVRHELQGRQRPVLLIVDNVTDQTDLALLPTVGCCRILMTTRLRHLAPPPFQVLPVGALTTEAALDLLRMGRVPEDVPEQDAAREIAEMLGHLPLALALVSHHVRRLDISYTAYRDRLRQPARRFEVLDTAQRRFVPATELSTGIFDAVAITHECLEPSAQQVLAAGSCSAGRSLSPELLFLWSGLADREAFDEALADLADASLITREEDRRFSVHELVRAFGWCHLAQEEQRAILDRAATVLAGCLERANDRMDWRDVRRELAHCRAVASLGAADGHRSAAHVRLAYELGNYSFYHGDVGAAAEFVGAALRLTERTGDSATEDRALFLRRLGEINQHLECGEEALRLVREARRITRKTLPPNDASAAAFVNAVGYVLKAQGKLRRALPFYRRALDITLGAATRDTAAATVYLNNLGAWYWNAGDLEQALDYFQQALEMAREAYHPRHPLVAARLNNVGRVLGQCGDWKLAAERHREAAEIYLQTYGRRHLDVAMSLLFLAQATEQVGDLDTARRCYSDSLAIQECIPTISSARVEATRRHLEALRGRSAPDSP